MKRNTRIGIGTKPRIFHTERLGVIRVKLSEALEIAGDTIVARCIIQLKRDRKLVFYMLIVDAFLGKRRRILLIGEGRERVVNIDNPQTIWNDFIEARSEVGVTNTRTAIGINDWVSKLRVYCNI